VRDYKLGVMSSTSLYEKDVVTGKKNSHKIILWEFFIVCRDGGVMEYAYISECSK
jgi:hypothetical protein